MDINRALRLAISTGVVTLGKQQAFKAISEKQAKLLILASNCPIQVLKEARAAKTPSYRFRGNNLELGAACGKPFSISTVTIIDEGNSEILALRPSKTAAASESPVPPVPAPELELELEMPEVPAVETPESEPQIETEVPAPETESETEPEVPLAED